MEYFSLLLRYLVNQWKKNPKYFDVTCITFGESKLKVKFENLNRKWIKKRCFFFQEFIREAIEVQNHDTNIILNYFPAPPWHLESQNARSSVQLVAHVSYWWECCHMSRQLCSHAVYFAKQLSLQLLALTMATAHNANIRTTAVFMFKY